MSTSTLLLFLGVFKRWYSYPQKPQITIDPGNSGIIWSNSDSLRPNRNVAQRQPHPRRLRDHQTWHYCIESNSWWGISQARVCLRVCRPWTLLRGQVLESETWSSSSRRPHMHSGLCSQTYFQLETPQVRQRTGRVTPMKTASPHTF